MCFMQLIYDNVFHVCMNPLAFVKERFMLMHAHTHGNIQVCGCTWKHLKHFQAHTSVQTNFDATKLYL